MFKIGKDSSNSNSNNNNQANVERTKDTKVLRKSCPGKKLWKKMGKMGNSYLISM